MTDNENIIDIAYSDETIPVVRYDISSYGADFDVAGLVERLMRQDIIVPKFQRPYVWDRYMASQFIESLLLGLPVPGVFLAREPNDNKLLVIDGQQRLKSLQYFYEGFFGHQPFELIGVQPQYKGFTYQTLKPSDRRLLDNSIIHATIIKLESPNDFTSIIHIFERINSTGLALTVQEMRNAVYMGPFIDLTYELNHNSSWRKIYGLESMRSRDQELIIRFLALYFDYQNYKQPLSEFINYFVAIHRDADENFLSKCKVLFENAINFVFNALGKNAFKPKKNFNAAIFDSVMVGIAKNIDDSSIISVHEFRAAYDKLLKDSAYEEAVNSPVSPKNVSKRIELAIKAFAVA